jgi:hypothetical protein
MTMLALFIFAPSLIAFAFMGVSLLFGKPIGLERVEWLFSEAQMVSLAIGCVAILLTRKSEEAMPQWRIEANKWLGRVLAASALFYLVAFFLVGYYGP